MDNFTTVSLVKLTIQEGGFSYSPITKDVNPKIGYMVALKGFEQTESFIDFDEDSIEKFHYQNFDKLTPDTFIGAWVDKDKVYMDLSVLVGDLEAAVWLGIRNGQKAIYDNARNRSIYLPTPQTTGTGTQQQTYLNMNVRQLLNQYK